MLKFQLVLKNEKAKTYTIISWLIIALNFVAFLYLGISGYTGATRLPLYAAGLLLLIYLFRFMSDREALENDCINLSFSFIIIAWIVLQFYWVAVVIFVLFLMEDISRRKLTVLFFDDRIVYPSFPKRTIEWKDLNNVILRDEVLTIDLKTNKVFQNEIISPASEMDFNEFCTNQINALKN